MFEYHSKLATKLKLLLSLFLNFSLEDMIKILIPSSGNNILTMKKLFQLSEACESWLYTEQRPLCRVLTFLTIMSQFLQGAGRLRQRGAGAGGGGLSVRAGQEGAWPVDTQGSVQEPGRRGSGSRQEVRADKLKRATCGNVCWSYADISL